MTEYISSAFFVLKPFLCTFFFLLSSPKLVCPKMFLYRVDKRIKWEERGFLSDNNALNISKLDHILL